MFDIVKFDAKEKEEKWGFESFYHYSEIKDQIKRAKIKESKNFKKELILPKDYRFDKGGVRKAEEKDNCFVINIREIIDKKGIKKSIELGKITDFLSLCNRYGAYYSFVSFAKKEKEIRSVREIIHVGRLLGCNKGQIEFSLRMLPHYLN